MTGAVAAGSKGSVVGMRMSCPLRRWRVGSSGENQRTGATYEASCSKVIVPLLPRHATPGA